MSFSLAPLLVHTDDVPPAARFALQAALAMPEERRGAELERAARLLFSGTDLDCAEVRDLIGLPATGTCV